MLQLVLCHLKPIWTIISKVWVKDQSTKDDKVFAIAICLYILDPKYKGMKLDPKK
ncbi:25089_t:CDS:1, partial [Gigaspora rosea]